MSNYFNASIVWKSFEEGGRRIIPPEGTRYCPLIHLFDERKQVEWSIDFICPNFSETNIITFCFVAKDAPYDLLKVSGNYKLFEGSKHVATITIK